MAIEVFKVKEGGQEPQIAFDVNTKTPHMTDVNGNVTSWHYRRFLGDLHVKQLVIEGRGYTRDDHPESMSEITYGEWRVTSKDDNGDDDVVVSEGSFASKSVVVESHRINEADMWRATKTVTIKALYVNGDLAINPDGTVVGVTDFAEEDFSI